MKTNTNSRGVSPQHTPGPWAPSEITFGAGSHGFKVEAQDHVSRVATDRFELAFVSNTTIPGEAQANARLIAAAPELLAAIKTVLSEADFGDDALLQQCRAALAKAEGNA